MYPLCNTNAEMVPVSTVWWIVIAAVLATLVISWIIFHHFLFNKKGYPKFCQRLEYCIETIGYWSQRLWYAILLIGSSIYFFNNAEQCMNLTFSKDFNGKNVIFIFWLVLLLFPLFEKFEGFGFSLKFRRQTEVSENAAYNAINNVPIMDADELNRLHRNGGKDE